MDYGWLITKDHTYNPLDILAKSEAGTMGGADTPYTAEEIKTKGAYFRMYDDDGDLYYEGYYLGGDGEDMFFPLDDFGTPNAGATEIRYRNKTTGKMEQL
jgi:hypothetical protein